MSILERYIGRTVAVSTLVVLAVLLALYTFVSFAEELEDVGKGNYDVMAALRFVVYSLPSRVHELFPAAALIGTMLGLGQLASSSELIAVRAAGVSLRAITLAVMKMGLLLMLVSLTVGEVVAPKAEQAAQRERAIAQGRQVAMSSEHGYWARDGRHFVNVRTLHADGRLQDLYIYEFAQGQRLQRVVHARAAAYLHGAWQLTGVAESRIGPDGVTTEHREQAQWPSLLSPELLNVVVVRPNALSAAELWDYIGYLRDNGLETTRYELTFWAKVVAPLTTGVMVFLAIPFVFGPLRSVSLGQRTLTGALVGMGFHIFDRAFQSFGQVYGLPPLASALLPSLVFLGVGVAMMRRVR
jgi:lipopolysaccharide export system permease protein